MAKISAATVATVVVAWVVTGLLTFGPGGVSVAFAEVLAPVAQATDGAHAVHMVLRMLTREGEGFGYVNLASGEMRSVEVWLEEPLGAGDEGRARLQKSDRTYWLDGRQSVLYLPQRNEAYRNVGLDANLFWPAQWVRRLEHAPASDVDVLDYEETGEQGRLVVRNRGVAMEPLEPAFFNQFDRETEVTWNLDTHRLTGLRRWVHYHGERRLFMELVSIDYAPEFDDALFTPKLPEDVRWGGVSDRPVPIDEIGIGPKEVARRIFEASIERDRDTLERYVPSPALVDWFMEHSVEIVSLGEPFRAGNYPGVYVPYEVRVDWGSVFHYTKKHNLALRNDDPAGRWELDGGW